MLEVKHIRKYYNQGTVNEMCLFEDFSLTVEQGRSSPWWEATVPEKLLC